MPLSIDLTVEHDAWAAHWARPGDLDALTERAVVATLAELSRGNAPRTHSRAPVDGAELSIVLCDDTFIRDLNTRWRGKAKATNVLSFPAAEAARAFTLGDIVVAYETTLGEANERGTPLADYLTHLIVHGLLHLLAFDHETAEDAAHMEALESQVLATLAIASPYVEASDRCESFETATEDAALLRVTP